MSLLLKAGSLFIILISIIGVFRSNKESDTLKKGKIVTVTVFSVPITCENSTKNIKAYFEFYFGNKIYSKRFDGHCNLKPRDKITLITNHDNSIFLFEDEKPVYSIASNLILFFIGVLCFFYSTFTFKKTSIYNNSK
jgi:hypothetical protein